MDEMSGVFGFGRGHVSTPKCDATEGTQSLMEFQTVLTNLSLHVSRTSERADLASPPLATRPARAVDPPRINWYACRISG